MDVAREIAMLVSQIPQGSVSTFADIAEALGDPHAATAVFRILTNAPVEGNHRVVRADGAVPRAGMTARLRRDGVTVSRSRVDELDRIRWREFRGPRTLAHLREEQERLAATVETTDRFAGARRIAAFDVAYDGDDATAAAVVMDAKNEAVLQQVAIHTKVDFPYIPGYLGYRELPCIEACYRRLDTVPDLLMIDGHGLLHPARFGVACFAGVRLDRPSIGVAKSLLVGRIGPPPKRAGDWADVRVDGETMGAALRSGRSRRLIYVSIGHRVSLATALRTTKQLCTTRIPEPLRRADLLSKNEKRKWKKR